MTHRDYLILFVLGVSVALVPAVFQETPGYMDADYYYLGGVNLASGKGLSEEVLWNYLDDPRALPHPSHAYWMPLTSLIAALGVAIGPGNLSLPVDGFPMARLGFVVVAGLIPPLTAWLATSFYGGRREGWLAGLVAMSHGFYLPFLPTTDTFGIYMVLGALFLQVAWCGYSNTQGPDQVRRHLWAPLGLGVISGAMHLARADGLIWLGIALLIPAIGLQSGWPWVSLTATPWKNRALDLLIIFGGYLVVMGPWIGRNLATFGTPLSPGGLRALWLVRYDDLFLYPPTLLTPERWWANGLGGILQTRGAALRTNLVSALAVQGMIFLGPLILIGLWNYRQDLRVKLGGAAWFATFITMTLIFPEPGARGGFFHSGAAIQILFWAVVPEGLRICVSWAGSRRGWPVDQATRFFQIGMVLLAFGLTAFIVQQRVIGQSWNASANHYREVSQAILENGGVPEEVVLVNNPPGYYLVSGQPAIVIPMGDVGTVLEAARKYDAAYLVLERNHPQPLGDLYENPRVYTGLEYLMTFGETHLFRIR